MFNQQNCTYYHIKCAWNYGLLPGSITIRDHLLSCVTCRSKCSRQKLLPTTIRTNLAKCWSKIDAYHMHYDVKVDLKKNGHQIKEMKKTTQKKKLMCKNSQESVDRQHIPYQIHDKHTCIYSECVCIWMRTYMNKRNFLLRMAAPLLMCVICIYYFFYSRYTFINFIINGKRGGETNKKYNNNNNNKIYSPRVSACIVQHHPCFIVARRLFRGVLYAP